MLSSNFFTKLGLSIYISIYLIFPNLAISKNTKVDISKILESAFNNKDFQLINNNFEEKEAILIKKRFQKIIKEFPETKWLIRKLQSKNKDENILNITLTGKKLINGKMFLLKSNFDYLFFTKAGKIKNGLIRNQLTTIRNDQDEVDIIFKIPDKVLTGTNYDIDIIVSEPLDQVIIAGGIKFHQEDSYIPQEIKIEPLVSGGIFKITRAPSIPGTQIWSGIIAHPKGIISFTKTVDIVEKI